MTFLINTFTAWDEPPRCRHQVAIELAKRHSVFFVEQNKIGLPRIRVVSESNRLTRIIPYWPLDYRLRYRIPLFNELFQEYLFRRIKRLIPFESLGDLRIITFDFTSLRIFNHFPCEKTVYYCNDDFISISRSNPTLIYLYHKVIEKKVISRSGYCIATSDFLYNKLASINSNTHLIPLGAPSAVRSEHRVYNNSNKNQETIRIGYVGFMLRTAFSTAWIKGCMTNKRFELVFIGPENEIARRHLLNRKHCTFIGQQTGDDLYSTLANINVCVAPYDIKDNLGSTPNKLWLYLSLGKPVVITRLPAKDTWEFEDDIIYKTDDNSSFPHLIQKAFLRDTKELFLKRIELADRNTWAQRVDQLLKILK